MGMNGRSPPLETWTGRSQKVTMTMTMNSIPMPSQKVTKKAKTWKTSVAAKSPKVTKKAKTLRSQREKSQREKSQRERSQKERSPKERSPQVTKKKKTSLVTTNGIPMPSPKLVKRNGPPERSKTPPKPTPT